MIRRLNPAWRDLVFGDVDRSLLELLMSTTVRCWRRSRVRSSEICGLSVDAAGWRLTWRRGAAGDTVTVSPPPPERDPPDRDPAERAGLHRSDASGEIRRSGDGRAADSPGKLRLGPGWTGTE